MAVINCQNIIDVALLSTELSQINIIDDVNVVLLDPVGPISSQLFREIFYNNRNIFQLQRGVPPINTIIEYVGLTHPYRTINGKPFYLVDTIYDNIEKDLNVSRWMFTPCSNIALNTELINLETFYDLNNLIPTCALTWDTLLKLVKSESESECIGIQNPSEIIIKLAISIMFTIPTKGVSPIMVKHFFEVRFPLPLH
jgi:hypothetical protein